MYVNENGNGKKGSAKSLLGEVALEYGSAQLGAISPLLAAATRVIRARQTAAATAPAPAPAPVSRSPFDLLRRGSLLQRTGVAVPTRPAAPKPSINVVTLPNGTAVPATILPPPSTPSQNGGAPVTTQAQSWDEYAGTQGGSAGSSFGPPANLPPVEVNTLPDDGDSTAFNTAGVSSLAGLTSNPMVLGLIAVAAFVMLDGKPKRKRRR